MASWWEPEKAVKTRSPPYGERSGTGQLVAVLDGAADLVHVGEVDLRVDALAEQVHAQGDQVDVAGAFAVAEEAALDAVGAGQVAELGRGDAGAAVVVRVQGEHDRVAVRQVAVHPLDRVGVDVRRRHFDGRRQVQDHLVLGAGLEDLGHGVGDALGELQLGSGEGLRGVFVGDLGADQLLLVLLAQARTGQGDVHDAVLVLVEHDAALQHGGGVVQVHDGLLGALERLVGALDQVFAGLGEHLDGDVVRDAAFDQLAHEVEVGLRGGREADLDFLEAHLDEQVEHLVLALGAHRVDQRLVSVTEVDRAPARGLR